MVKALAVLLLLCIAGSSSTAVAGRPSQAVVVFTVPPKYRRELPEGKGWFRLTLDSSGHVLSVAVISTTGHRELDASAIAALKQWRFKPVPENYVVMPVEFSHKIRGRGMRVDKQ